MSDALVELGLEEAVTLGAQSLSAFGHIFFPRTFRQESPPMHETIGRDLYGPARYNAFSIFRDGAKTTLLRVFTAQRVSYAISRTAMYVSISQQHSIFSVRWLKRQVEYNTRWAQAFRLKKGPKWTDEWIEIEHGIEECIITVLAMGITGQIRGFNPDDFRPDLIISDDILNEENTATPEQRKKLSELFFGALLNSLAPETEAPHAKAVLLQTPLHREDILATCLADPAWNGRIFSCFDERGQSTWPSRWPTEVLNREKAAAVRRGQYRLWMREKEGKIVAGNDKAIDITKIRYYDVLPDVMVRVIVIDPASSDAPDADHHVVMTVGLRGLDYYVLALHVAKAVMPDEASNAFFNQVLNFGPIMRAGVESIAYQRTLKWYIEQQMRARRTFVPIQMIQDKRSKANRITQAIPGVIAYGHLHIHSSMSDLVTQADDYDPQVDDQEDDILDALSMAIVMLTPHLADKTVEGDFRRIDDEEDETYSRPMIARGAP